MKRIFVVGGNGFAKECYQLIMLVAKEDNEVSFGGFLGHNKCVVDLKDLQGFFLADLEDFTFGANDYAVIGAGSTKLREKIFYDIKKKENAKFYTLCLPSFSFFSSYIEMGEGNIFMPPCFPSIHVKIGNGNLFNGEVVIGHDVEVGNFNFFAPKSQLLGNVRVGHSNSIGAASILLPNAKIGNHNMIAPLSAVYKGCKDNSYLLGNPALKQ